MMRKTLLATAGILCGCCAYAQNELDKYTTSTNTFTEVGNNTHGLNNPQDLDFVPGRPNECWVVNRESAGGSVVIYFNPGKSNQFQQFRRDSHNGHFMARTVAVAFGDNDNFTTAQDILTTNGPGTFFMGPALWTSDTAIFARENQDISGALLGSHIDMLHQSPYGMGVAYDNGNAYWYFDGHNGNICHYDFAAPHIVGGDDHSDGKVRRYSDVTVTRKPNLPSHMAYDKQNNWLYIVDGGANRVIRMKTNTGTVGANLTPYAEPLAEFKEVTGATKEVMVSSGLTAPCGIDYRNGRIIVSDNSTGNIHIYDVSTSPATLVGTIITGGPGVMGVKITNDNKIWYVNSTTNKLYRIDNPNVVSVEEVTAKLNYTVYPNPAGNILNIRMDDMTGTDQAIIRIFDVTGRQVYTNTTGQQVTTINTSAWAKGIYNVILSYKNATEVTKAVIQ